MLRPREQVRTARWLEMLIVSAIITAFLSIPVYLKTHRLQENARLSAHSARETIVRRKQRGMYQCPANPAVERLR